MLNRFFVNNIELKKPVFCFFLSTYSEKAFSIQVLAISKHMSKRVFNTS